MISHATHMVACTIYWRATCNKNIHIKWYVTHLVTKHIHIDD